MEVNTTHGENIGGNRSPEYRAWKAMIDRCYNPRNARYANYGGRGITVCDQWRRDFPTFLADLGRRPSPRHSLERIENDQGYEPGNCCWALPHDQMANRRNTQRIEGIPIATLAKQHDIPANTLRFRIMKGWDLTEALTKPVRPKARPRD